MHQCVNTTALPTSVEREFSQSQREVLIDSKFGIMVDYVCYELYVLDWIGRSTRRQGQRKFPFFVKGLLDLFPGAMRSFPTRSQSNKVKTQNAYTNQDRNIIKTFRTKHSFMLGYRRYLSSSFRLREVLLSK